MTNDDRETASPRDGQTPPPSLAAAIRRARTEEAERSEVVAELRGAERARLEMLADALAPVFAQVPEDVDIFDAGIVPGERPRLWIDIIAFVEMGRDRRQFRFVQNTRHGRVPLAESERLDVIVQAVTEYVARRIVERELALAADRSAMPTPAAAAPVPRRSSGLVRVLLGFVDFVGALVLFVVLAGASYWAWKTGWTWWTARG